MHLETLEETKVYIDRKFSGSTYTCNAVLDHVSDEYTVWKLEFSSAVTGKRLPQYDGMTKCRNDGMTWAL